MSYQLILYMDTDLKKVYMLRNDAYNLHLIKDNYQDEYLDISIDLLVTLINENIDIKFLKLKNLCRDQL